MGKLNNIDKAAEGKGSFINTLWQFIKFIVVSLGAFVIQTFLPLLIKAFMSENFLYQEYKFLMFSSAVAEATTGEPTGLGIFIASTASNIIAQIVAFFVNKEKTFNSGANTKVVLPIYIIFTVALIAFSAWLLPFLNGFFVSKGLSANTSLTIANACCGAVQFFLYFPVDKILFHKKKEEKTAEEQKEDPAEVK